MASFEKMLEEVRLMIAEVLALESDEVETSSRFFQDLGGESIDMLELAFLCEKRYSARIPVQSMGVVGELATDSQGRLTQESLDSLKQRYPFLPVSSIEDDPRPGRIQELVTVEAIARFVSDAVNKPQAAS